MNVTALIAEDEPILAQALAAMLGRLWPDLHLLPLAQDGEHAIELAGAEQPDVLFLDIRMPGLDGLEAAEAIVDAWPPERPLPLIVFVTAYDEHAVEAFERAAVDYVLKPVQTARLETTCARLRTLLKQRAATKPFTAESGPTSADDDLALPAVQALQQASQARPAAAPLSLIQASVGSGLQMVPIEDVLYFEAADKYVRVVTGSQREGAPDLLIRTPLRELVPQLDERQFWQVHRSVVVNVRAIDRVTRVGNRMRLNLRDRPEALEISRMYAWRFKAM
ncbi:MAG: response regulator transcription factor [Rubrivivax sp.]|nr:MAG: response regulator transcription factor [Rubrivivax sp.]